jgi:hypothetical protein
VEAVDGDDLRVAAAISLYDKRAWPGLAEALAQAETGNGSLLRTLTDQFYMRLADNSYDALNDRYFAIDATEQRYPRKLAPYLSAGARAWRRHPHFYFNSGYSEIAYSLFPAHDRDAFSGPFRLPRSAVTPLVVATTFDPATPYRDARRLVGALGKGRILTMNGDGHTAYGNGSPGCVDAAVNAYLIRRALPRAGRTCVQHLPFRP